VELVEAIVIGVVSGILASFAVWWTLFSVFAPRLRWAPTIAKFRLPGDTEPRYQLQLANVSRRAAVDVSVVTRLRVPSLIRAGSIENLDVQEPFSSPMIRGHNAVRWRIRAELIPPAVIDRYRSYLPAPFTAAVDAGGSIPLEEIFFHGDVRLVVFAFATDARTGSRRFSTWEYDVSAIREGRFTPDGGNTGVVDEGADTEAARRIREEHTGSESI
jgi:hypothetical protein